MEEYVVHMGESENDVYFWQLPQPSVLQESYQQLKLH